VKECALDVHDERDLGCTVARSYGLSYPFVTDNETKSKDTQRFASTGHQKNQTHLRIVKNIAERIQPPVPMAIRHHQSRVVEHLDKA
jgi:hypothetical protein